MEDKKVLYLGYYDCGYIEKAWIIEDNKFKEYELQNLTDFDLFNDLTSWFKPQSEIDEIKKKLDYYFGTFDEIIACEDAHYYKIK